MNIKRLLLIIFLAWLALQIFTVYLNTKEKFNAYVDGTTEIALQ